MDWNLTDQQLFERLAAIDWVKEDRDDCVQVLRTAVRLLHDSEAALETLRTAIARGEAALVYGASGRPVRQFPPPYGLAADFNPFGDDFIPSRQGAKGAPVQTQSDATPLARTEKCARRCDMAGTTIDCASIDSHRALQICSEGCQSLSQCKQALGT